ncbi:hypothetical protein E1B28_010524 [Marasmius oreades]|uniref:Uncharacterized protein n=1 Tax=Marasmius oreades TaxID=181124 RepID=A0A9P7RXX6_9AGAR|nr:uncharacterized protein E1B28_010524 [Marasmius oreades]KAG7091493.1 hypothetical protein E1B28_010524 [Marasmius oreades]
MSSGHFFEGSSKIHFSGNPLFTNAKKVTINNYSAPARTAPELGILSTRRDDDQWLTLRGSGQRLRRIDMCDVLILREVSSETHRLSVKLKPTNPFRNRVKSFVKIRKRRQSAEIVPGFGDRRFTVVSLEPEDNGDVERIQRVLEPLYEIGLSQRRVCLTQLFGVGRSMTPTPIYHDEVIDGWTFMEQYWKTPIVGTYLVYRFVNSFFDVLDDGMLQKLSIPVETGWTFNLRTRSFQYDVITAALSDEDEEPYMHRLPPLPHKCNPLLDSNEIVRAVPDLLQLVSSFADLTSWNPRHHNILTFGTVIDRRKPGILAYFPSIPSPVWSCRFPTIGTPDISAKYSKSVPSLVDLTFAKNHNKWNLHVHFSLRLPEDSRRFRTAFLTHSLTHRPRVPGDLVFIDELCFFLNGTFTSDPSSCNPPKYLHVPPLSPKWIDNMPCLRWPPNARIFYWSFDRRGRMEIPEEDWEKYEIPNLEVQTFVGSTWHNDKYQAVAEYFHLTKYDLGGQQFADDHGYPILVQGDPHAAEIQASRNTITSGKSEMAIKDSPAGSPFFAWPES